MTTPIALVFGLVAHANGAFSVVESRSEFGAVLAGAPSTIEGWDEFASGTIIPNGALVNGVVYHLDDPTAGFIVTSGGADVSSPNGLGRTNNPFGSEAFIPGDIIVFAFSTPISAFGVSFNTASLSPAAYSLTTNFGDTAFSALDPFPGLATGQFGGFISSERVTNVTIRSLVPFQFGLDDMIFVTPLPEPPIVALLGLGLVGLLASRRST
ncbi:MAG: PEP-CTERM sorting domain-containing protein [Vicinamibacterales bacterium]